MTKKQYILKCNDCNKSEKNIITNNFMFFNSELEIIEYVEKSDRWIIVDNNIICEDCFKKGKNWMNAK